MREENAALTQPSPESSREQASAQPSGSEAASSSPPPSAPPQPPASPPVRRGAGIAIVLSALALTGAGLAAWQVLELRSGVTEVRKEVAERLAAGDRAVADLRAITRQQQESVAALQGKIGALEAQVAATEGQAAALETLYQEFSRTQEDRLLAEVAQAIGMADQHLQLAGNLEAALIVLRGAEARLAAQDRGPLQALRRALLRDIEELKDLPQVDVPGIALRLERLLERADALPLAFAGELPAGDGRAHSAGGQAQDEASPLDLLKSLALDIWRELKTLVRVERLDQDEPVLLAPAQSTFLRENLKIRLLTARLALLARDGRTYEADLAQARSWIERFFDRRDEGVQRTVAELRALEAMPVAVQQADLTESLAALRLLQARAGESRQAGRAPAEEGEGPESPAGAATSPTPPPTQRAQPAAPAGTR